MKVTVSRHEKENRFHRSSVEYTCNDVWLLIQMFHVKKLLITLGQKLFIQKQEHVQIIVCSVPRIVVYISQHWVQERVKLFLKSFYNVSLIY